MYPRFIRFLKDLDGFSALNDKFERDESEPRIILDSVHLRLWRAWTVAIKMAFNKKASSDNNK
jgi:hypothetical protein